MHIWGGAVRAALGVVLAFSVAGCDLLKDDEDEAKPNGIEDMSVREALAEVKAATRDLDDIWLTGKGFADFGTGPRRVDANFIVTRKACSATFSSEAVGEMRLKVVGRTAYVRADKKAATQLMGIPPEQAALARSRWFSLPAPAESERECGIVSALYVQSNDCRRGKTGEVDATPSIAFRCTSPDGRPTTLHVSTVDEPLVLRVVGEDEEGPFDLTLVDHNTDTEVEAPPKASVIALPR